MKTILAAIFITLFVVTSSSADKLYFKVGTYDYKHETGMLAFNLKNVTNNKFDIYSIGELTQIYEFTGMIDKDNNFSKGEDIKYRDEYAIYLSSGLQKKINFSENLEIVPSFSAGLYQEFDQGKDMGFPIEFKSEIELNYHLFDNSIIGLTYNHISNANIGDTNPGSDSVLITFIVKENF
tara:strand:+ start:367 stop:906 length:540 start_codon:yes stop_codon:yes gene_type:complete